jgi:hypothetical protein
MPPYLAGWTNGPAIGSDPGIGGHAHHKERDSSIAYNYHPDHGEAIRLSNYVLYKSGLQVGCHEVALVKFYKFHTEHTTHKHIICTVVAFRHDSNLFLPSTLIKKLGGKSFLICKEIWRVFSVKSCMRNFSLLHEEMHKF